MKNMNLHQQIKASVEQHLNFLQEEGFTAFEYQQLAYEIHLFCVRDKVKVDVCYELIYSTPIWITVRGLHVGILEENNVIIQKIYDRKSELYDDDNKKYIKTEDGKYLKTIEEKYCAFGHILNDEFIKEVSEILQRHPDVLSAESDKMQRIQDNIFTKREIEKKKYDKENTIYNCEYGYEDGLTFWHEGTLAEIERHIAEQSGTDFTNFVIFDWDGNIVEQKK